MFEGIQFLKAKKSFHRHVTYFRSDIRYPSGSSTCLVTQVEVSSLWDHQHGNDLHCFQQRREYLGTPDGGGSRVSGWSSRIPGRGWLWMTWIHHLWCLSAPPEVGVLSFMKWSWPFSWGSVGLITIPEDDVSHQWNRGYFPSVVLLEFLSWPFPHDKLLGVMAAERAFREDFVFIHVQRLRHVHSSLQKTCLL